MCEWDIPVCNGICKQESPVCNISVWLLVQWQSAPFLLLAKRRHAQLGGHIGWACSCILSTTFTCSCVQRITGAPLTASAGGGLWRLIAACAWFLLGSCRAGCRVYFGKVAKPLWAFVTERTSGFVLSQGNGLAGAASTELLQEGRLAGAAEVDRY